MSPLERNASMITTFDPLNDDTLLNLGKQLLLLMGLWGWCSLV